MGISKTKKATKALQERVDTIDLNGDMIESAIGREAYEATLNCRDEIKDLLDGSEAKSRQIGYLSKKIERQKKEIERLREGKNLGIKQIVATTELKEIPDCCRNCPYSEYKACDSEFRATCSISEETLELENECVTTNRGRTRVYRGNFCPLREVSL